MSFRVPLSDNEVDTSIKKLKKVLEDIEEQSVQKKVIPLIHSMLLSLWKTSWRQSMKSGQITIVDPTEHCLALLTLKKDGSFKEPKDVTGLISKFEYCMRLTFLYEKIHVMVKSGSEDMGSGEQRDEEYACNKLQRWFIEGVYSTFACLQSLQHVASSMAYSTRATPHIWWLDRENLSSLSYQGHCINFADICQIFYETEKLLVETWEKKILQGLDISTFCETIVDDLTKKDVGYSFLLDPRNVELRDHTHLIQAIVHGRGKFKHFLLEGEGKLTWNREALRKWLLSYAELQKLLLLRAQMLSGAPARGTEITAMIYHNTQARSTRNLMCMGSHLTLLCQYSKTTAFTGEDKLIPHGLDAVTSDILLQDLSLARPFAEIASKICFNDHNITMLYRNHLFVNFDRLFTTDDLSQVMTQHSQPFIDFPLTVSSWRHIQTAWKRKFNCSVEDIIVIDQTDDVDALQAGHSHSTENRIYGLSTSALAGAAEDILPLFLDASITWQNYCKVVPGGHLLPYHQTLSNHSHVGNVEETINQQPSTSVTSPLIASQLDLDALAERIVASLAPRLATTSTKPSIDMDVLAKKVAEHLAPTLTTMVDMSVKAALSSMIQKHP